MPCIINKPFSDKLFGSDGAARETDCPENLPGAGGAHSGGGRQRYHRHYHQPPPPVAASLLPAGDRKAVCDTIGMRNTDVAPTRVVQQRRYVSTIGIGGGGRWDGAKMMMHTARKILHPKSESERKWKRRWGKKIERERERDGDGERYHTG